MTAIWAWLTGKVGAVLGPLAILGAIIAAVFGAGRRTATVEAQRDALRQDLQNVEKRDEAEAAVARVPDPAARLRDRWNRD